MIRKIIHIDEEKCNGCGLCANACHEGAIDMVDGKAKLAREHFCDGFGDCLPNCPTGAITFEEREAPEYDAEAVKENQRKKQEAQGMSGNMTEHAGGGCPGSRFMQFNRGSDAAVNVTAAPAADNASACMATDASGNIQGDTVEERTNTVLNAIREAAKGFKNAGAAVSGAGSAASGSASPSSKPMFNMAAQAAGMSPCAAANRPTAMGSGTAAAGGNNAAGAAADAAYGAAGFAYAKPQPRLSQWPVQIKLIPVKAPFFDGAKLLIAADCTAYAYANMHEEFMKGRITLIGCPKLDDVDYSDKLTQIISENDIKSVTIVRMEVPCCGGLQRAAENALRASGKFIPWQVVTISRDGRILD